MRSVALAGDETRRKKLTGIDRYARVTVMQGVRNGEMRRTLLREFKEGPESGLGAEGGG